MKSIIPFKKDIIFKTKLVEITSISLENTLKIVDGVIAGDFIISGEYKKDEKTFNSEPFDLKLSFKSVIDEKYITDRAFIDIDDFYYEIISENTLSVSIDVLVDKLEEKPLIELDNLKEIEELKEDIKIEKKEEKFEDRDIDIKEKITTLFNTNEDDNYVIYNVCIVRENDTIDSILEKYSITREQLEKYNDLSDIKIGDKILIPSED